MATDTHDQPREFIFDVDTVERTDVYHIYYRKARRGGGQQTTRVTILFSHITPHAIWGMATSETGDWCSPWGPITFHSSLVLNELFKATFNEGGAHAKTLICTPIDLERVRNGRLEHPLG